MLEPAAAVAAGAVRCHLHGLEAAPPARCIDLREQGCGQQRRRLHVVRNGAGACLEDEIGRGEGLVCGRVLKGERRDAGLQYKDTEWAS